MSPEELQRYDRHLLLPEVGAQGQARLKAASVALVGLGGLGSPVALYLAAAGVGRLGLIDFDRVDASNLQRQVVHGSRDVGRLKVESAGERLRDLNPFIELDLVAQALRADNALELLGEYDLILDGSDNFSTRYLVNDACARLGKPFLSASIYRFEGQLSLFHAAAGTGCYRCLYPEPPPPELAPSCAEAGVLGVLPGVLGSLQANEALKFLLGLGQSLQGRLLLFDALACEFRQLRLRPTPGCPACEGRQALMDQAEVCLSPAQLSPGQFFDRWQSGWRPLLLDVREPHEWEIVNLSGYGAKLLPLSRIAELTRAEEVVVYCKSGGRSRRAQEQLLQAGFAQVYDLKGGILAWQQELEPDWPRY